MKQAHDIYAELNPAFCAIALAAFADSYCSVKSEGFEVPLCYLILPIALSGDLASTFSHTTKDTVFKDWLHNNPAITFNFADRVNTTLIITTDALQFGCLSNTITLAQNGKITAGEEKIKKTNKNLKDPFSAASIINRSQRLGFWLANTGSTRMVYDALGVTL